jgi:hypothetical protein
MLELGWNAKGGYGDGDGDKMVKRRDEKGYNRIHMND